MASSDDEGETFPDAITDYAFYNKDDDPLSFSMLPVQWNENESSSANAGPIFLSGYVDNGLRQIYQQVKAWKYDISATIPKISVLSKDNYWIKLEKPRKSYEGLIRTILISVHCLCVLKSKPEASEKSLWNHLSNVFSLYDVIPSENDLIDHISFVREAVERNATLAKSKFLAAFLANPRKRKSHNEDAGTATKPSFIVDDMNGETRNDDIITNQIEDSESDEEDDQFDSVCAICDEGGSLTCCDGECFRSFHATPYSEEAQDSMCESLGLTSKELEALRHQQYKCENCKYNLHQCFVCAKLGSSDTSSNTEVFRCCSATCGHFYHPECVAKFLQRNDKAEQQALRENIAAGEPFVCPAHKCAVCKQIENEKVEDLQFATCRRCPKSYHRKCLPSDIMFDHQIGDDDETEVRAWDGVLPKSRALIYCVEHEIDPELGTPARPIVFKNIRNRKAQHLGKNKVTVKSTDGDSEHPSKKSFLKSQKVVENISATKSEGSSKKRPAPSLCPESLKKKKVTDDSEHPSKKSVLKSQKGVEKSFSIKPEGSFKNRPAPSSCPESLKKKIVADTSRNTSRNPLRRNLSTKIKNPIPNDGQPTIGSRLFDLFNETISNNLEEDDTSVDGYKQIAVANFQQTEILPPLDDKSKQRILALMKEAASSVTLDEVKKSHLEKVPSTHAHSSMVDKMIYVGRVEGAVKAINVAAKKLKEGCSVEDVKAVCDPAVIVQLMKWKERLRVYLAPFLHGMRYTSFGRHFTKVEKLEKIADKLQWYIKDGDMVVDFCCGANDFSCLVKKRLDEMGKTNCSYKNYDIAQSKNDFNFEKKDWMKVSPKELPNGSRLIMGLNPPFGVNASLANQFIANALLFKPKLIILIVPPETRRLDSSNRRLKYDLIWEDANLLAGKSFYFPGSADVNGNQVDQWNNIAPPLYLWSRPDWTYKHRSIAQQHGHIPRVQTSQQSDENRLALNLSVGNNELERTTHKGKRTDEQQKKTYQNSSMNKRHGQESEVDKHDDQGANRTHAQKHEKGQPGLTRTITSATQRYAPRLNETITSATQRYAPRLDETITSATKRYAPRLDELNNTITYATQRYAPRLDELNNTITSATQRYAPRLDELNNVRANNLGRSRLEEMNSARICGVGQLEPPMGSHSVGGYGPPLNGPGSHMDYIGFAPGPGYQHSQHYSSAG